MDGYLRMQQLKQELNPGEARDLLDRTRSYIETHELSPEFSGELEELTQSLQQLTEEMNE